MKDKLILWFPELNEIQIKRLLKMFEQASLYAKAGEVEHIMNSHKLPQRLKEKLEIRLFIHRGKIGEYK